MKKGFTLIELLAVIIILAVVSIIATPMVLEVVDDSKLSANKSNAYSLLDAAKLYYSESLFDTAKALKVNSVTDIYNDITVSGNKPAGGKLYVNKNGNTALSAVIDGKCYIKEFAGELQVLDSETCDLGYVGIDEINPILTISTSAVKTNDWYKENLHMNIKVIDEEGGSGANSYKYCVDSVECDPSYTVDSGESSVYITTERINYLCVIGYDRAGNYSTKQCETIKLDKTAPTVIPTTEVISITKGDEEMVSSYFTTTYSISGGTQVCNPENVSSLNTGTQDVICTATGGNGLVTTGTKSITITYDPYTTTNAISNGSFEDGITGWYKSEDNILISNENHKFDGYSIKNNFGTQWSAAIKSRNCSNGIQVLPNHQYYFSVWQYTKASGDGFCYAVFGFHYDSNEHWQYDLSQTNLNVWEKFSGISIAPNVDSPQISLGISDTTSTNKTQECYSDGVMIIDLTSTFGAGNEPSKEWCDSHIEYFDGTATIYK